MLIQLVSEKYFRTHFSTANQFTEKCYLPLFSFFLLENISSVLLLNFDLGVTQMICNHYDSIYRINRVYWPLNIKKEFVEEINANQLIEYGLKNGVVSYIGSKITCLYNFLW